MSSTDCDKTASKFNGLIDVQVKLSLEFEVFDQKLHYTYREHHEENLIKFMIELLASSPKPIQ